ncbi:MAG TPA: Entericidin EcnAB [Candidatus Competibacteraceae bacterium]|nr:Entericidin EcnAB [Candidatus Competibacteraceae bacterium]
MNARIPRLAIVLLMLISPLGLMACNTMQGVGADVKAAGQAIEGEAAKKKTY